MLFGIGKKTGINDYIEEFEGIENGLLVDVRDRWEYDRGHIPGAVSISLEEIEEGKEISDDRERTIYLYCLNGPRALKAAGILKERGYTDVTPIGGFSQYKGPVES